MSFILKSKKTIPYILNGQLFSIIEQIGENVTVKCSACPPERLYRGSFKGTGNFHMHIKRRHPELLGQLHDLKIQNLLQRKEMMVIKNRHGGNAKRRIKKERDSSGQQITLTMEEPLDFSTKKCENMVVPQPQISPSSSGTLSPYNQQIYNHQNDYDSVMPTELPQTIVHRQPSVKAEDEISEILDLSMRTSESTSPEIEIVPQNTRFFENVLNRIESCFEGIRDELKQRNQIESQRMNLEVAKFKYLHPYFSYEI